MRRLSRLYSPLLARAVRRPLLTGTLAALAFAGSLAIVPWLGAEFLPTLDEGSIVVMMYRVPGISLSESRQGNRIIEHVLGEFPEVSRVVCRTCRPEIATDPMAIDQSDVYVFLKPVAQWPRRRSKNALVADMKEKLEKEAPGARYSFSQPIQMRTQELMEAGVRSDLAIKLFGEDLEVLRRKAEEIAAVVARVPGAADVRAERVAGLPYLRVRVRRDAIARHGLDAADVLETIEAIGGKTAGQVVEGSRRFPLQVRFGEGQRSTAEAISNLKVGDREGHFIPLSELAEIRDEEGPAQISREDVSRRISVEVNVRGRDLAGFVADARRAVRTKVSLPAGYSLEWGGQFEQLESASRRLAVAAPAALVVIFALLYLSLGGFSPAALVFLNVPLAATGGILALFVRGMPFSISAGVGFIALFGIAVLNGIVLLAAVLDLRRQGSDLEVATLEAARTRLRPVLTTALVASLGFMPMALSSGAGAEVQRPLATVVIGGLATSTLLTLLVLPAAYVWLEKRRRTVTGL